MLLHATSGNCLICKLQQRNNYCNCMIESETLLLVEQLYFNIHRGGRGPWLPLLGKRSSKVDHFTPLILRIFLIFCIYLTSLNVIIPKKFQPHFAWHNFILLLFYISCPCIFKIFAGGFKGTNHVISCLCIHENIKYFII